jgi:hypothetical protein
MSNEQNTLEQEAQKYYDAVFDEELKALLEQADNGDDDARESLEYRAYGIGRQVRYYVTLAGGGPAARLVVEIDEYGGIENAWFEYQDWFTPWVSAPRQDKDLVERFAAMVGCYEP